MVLIFAGKAAPDLKEIKRRINGRFGILEVYVDQSHYEKGFEDILMKAKEDFGVEFCSIHTPHVEESLFPKYLDLTEKVTEKVGIKKIVVHSDKIDEMFSEKILKLMKPNMLIENSGNTTPKKIEEVMNSGFKVCLDTAHLYKSSKKFEFDCYESLHYLLKNFKGGIRHVHLNDAKGNRCNLPLEGGDMDYKKVLKDLQRFYSGVVVVETPQKFQNRDLVKILNYIS